MPRVLKTMRRSLLQEELASSLKVPDTGDATPLRDASFVDDMALPIVCPANILTSHIADVCGIVYLVFRMYRMELLFSLVKSAVVLKFQGPGKKKALSDLSKSKNLWQINKPPVDFTEVFIGAVDSYKHLGTQISFKGMAYEVSFRCGLMRAEPAS